MSGWRLSALAGWFALSALADSGAAISVHTHWIRAAPPASRVHAAYMVIDNHSARTVTLVTAHARRFARVQIHQSRRDNGLVRMRHIRDGITIAPDSRLRLQPGGYHLMLLDPLTPVAAGDEVEITLRFASGQSVHIRTTVRHA